MKLVPITACALLALSGSALGDDEFDALSRAPTPVISVEQAAAGFMEAGAEFMTEDPQLALAPGAGAIAVTGGIGRVEIDKDAAGGYALATQAGRLDVTPDGIGYDATPVALVPGADVVVAANTADGADTMIRPTPGGMQTFTLIREPSAPTDYTWTFSLPQTEALRAAPGGGAYVVGRNGAVVAHVAKPWARDANGQPVASRYSVEGDRLTLHVDHTAPGVVYPVIADPFVEVVVRIARKAGPIIVKVGRTAVPYVKRCAKGAVPGVFVDGLPPNVATAAQRALTGCLSGVGISFRGF